jgi:uncharacterized RDD family membrane protein YckC
MNTYPHHHELKNRGKILVYFLAAPEEEDECRAIRKHLTPVIRNSKIPIEIDSDYDIPSGEDIEKYKLKLFEADIVLALISSDYISNDETYERTQKVIERYNKNETILVPILVRNCLWKSTPFVNLPLLPKNFQPLNNKQFWNSEDDALMAVVDDIYEAINEFSYEEEATQPAPVVEVISVAGKKAKPVAAIADRDAIGEQTEQPGPVSEIRVAGESPAKEFKPAIEPEKKTAEKVQADINISDNQGIPETYRQKTTIPIEADWRKQYYKNVLWKRLFAFILDNLIMIPVFLFILIIITFFAFVFKDPTVNDLTDNETFFIFLIGFSTYFIICAKMESSKWRGTFGKRILKLQITDREGHPISFVRALGRNLLRAVTGYSYLFFLPLIIQIFRFKKTKKLFHDQLSSTVIGERLTS